MKKNVFRSIAALIAIGCSLVACGPGETPSETATEASSLPEEESAAKTSTDGGEETESTSVPEEEELSADAAYLFDAVRGWDFCFESGAGAWGTYLTVDEQGRFSGQYHDSDAGDVGTGYENGTISLCNFTGRFTNVARTTSGVYEATVTDLTYEKEPGDEEIKDGVRYVYREAYGISGTEKVEIYLPGAKTAKLPKEYVDWIENLRFGVSVSGQYYLNVPSELPFCGIYNPATKYGFASENVSGRNLTYLVNRASFPGLASIRSDFHEEDGTYFYQDMSQDGLYLVYNLCYLDEKGLNLWGGQEDFVNDCISHLMEGQAFRDVSFLDPSDADYAPDLSYVNGGGVSIVASWLAGNNEDTRFYVARLTKLGRFVYAYGYSSSEYDELMQGEAGSFFLSSLTFSGDRDKISSANPGKVVKKIHAIVINNGSDASQIFADEVTWINSGDEELMAKYHLTEEDLTDDYAIANDVEEYKAYVLSESCPIYVQFPEEGPFSELQTKSAFHKKLMDADHSYLMELYLDENNNVTFLYEPYRP
ncbi:MAG: hypothetical protein K6F51_15305 [Acetatifactor sp.]|nr:hypothetical protein [Acetatifactor sp.]